MTVRQLKSNYDFYTICKTRLSLANSMDVHDIYFFPQKITKSFPFSSPQSKTKKLNMSQVFPSLCRIEHLVTFPSSTRRRLNTCLACITRNRVNAFKRMNFPSTRPERYLWVEFADSTLCPKRVFPEWVLQLSPLSRNQNGRATGLG